MARRKKIIDTRNLFDIMLESFSLIVVLIFLSPIFMVAGFAILILDFIYPFKKIFDFIKN